MHLSVTLKIFLTICIFIVTVSGLPALHSDISGAALMRLLKRQTSSKRAVKCRRKRLRLVFTSNQTSSQTNRVGTTTTSTYHSSINFTTTENYSYQTISTLPHTNGSDVTVSTGLFAVPPEFKSGIIKGENQDQKPYPQGVEGPLPAKYGVDFYRAIRRGIKDSNIVTFTFAAASLETENGQKLPGPENWHKFKRNPDGSLNPLAFDYGPFRMSRDMLTRPNMGYTEADIQKINSGTLEGATLAAEAFEKGINVYGKTTDGNPDLQTFMAFLRGGSTHYDNYLSGKEEPDQIRGRINLWKAYAQIQAEFERDPQCEQKGLRPWVDRQKAKDENERIYEI